MKVINILIGLLFFTSAYSQTEYDYSFENKVLQCFYAHHHHENIDVKPILDRMEELLVEYGILADQSGDSYEALLRKVQIGDKLLVDDEKLLESFGEFEYFPSSVYCQDTSLISVDSLEYERSKFKSLIAISDTIQTKQIISPGMIAGEILEVLSARDFENEFYRTMGIIIIVNLIQVRASELELGLIRKLPPLDDESELETIEDHNKLVVLIDGEDQIYAGGQPIELRDLLPLAKKFILETADKTEVELPEIGKQMSPQGVILLQNERETTYKMYIEVQNQLLSVYSEIRNDYSMEFYDTPYEELAASRRKIIEQLVPRRISESDPQ